MPPEKLQELIEEESIVTDEIAAAEDIITEIHRNRGVHHERNENMFCRDSIDALVHNEKTEEIAELLELEDDIPKVVQFIRELLEEGKDIETKHKNHVHVIKEFLRAHRALKKVMQEERGKAPK